MARSKSGGHPGKNAPERSERETDEPLDPRLKSLFVHEIDFQCRWVLSALDGLRAHTASRDAAAVHFFAHAFLTHAAIVSKILWPAEAYRRRGEELRAELGLGDDLLIKGRKFRNHLEHFDERLHKWAAQSERRNSLGLGLYSKGQVRGLDPGDQFRVFDPQTEELQFRGETYDLPAVAREVQEIVFPAAERWIRQRSAAT